jgi:hypothetical protein
MAGKDKDQGPVTGAEAEELGRQTGKPASQVEAETAQETEQERTERESRLPGGTNTVPSDPRGVQEEPAAKDSKDAR